MLDMNWVLKVLRRIVFCIEFKDMEGCRLQGCCYLCVLGDYVCVYEMISGICTVPSFEFNEERVRMYMLLLDMVCLLRV